MRSFARAICGGVILAATVTTASADDAKEAAIQQDKKLLAGTWRAIALVINGNQAAEEDARKLVVVKDADGAWTVFADGNQISKGATEIDPAAKPKTVNFTPTEGGGVGNLHLGIYEVGEKTRRLCFAPPGKERPTEFNSMPGSEHILITFEREETKQ